MSSDVEGLERVKAWLARGNPTGGMNLPSADGKTPSVRSDLRALVAKAAETHAALAARVGELEGVLEKVNAIRNSIIGCQSVNFSEHVYPLVAALNEAGFTGQDYAEARENVGTMLERTLAAEARAEAAERRVGELEGALRKIAFLRPGGPCRSKLVEQMERLAIDAIDRSRALLPATQAEDAP